MRTSLLIGLFVYQDAAAFSQVDNIAELLLREKVDAVFDVIENHADELPRVATSNIPEFSKMSEIDNVLAALIETGEVFPGYLELGRVLCQAEKGPAQRKWGENHYKLAALLGLTTRTFPMKVTDLGMQYYRMDEESRRMLLQKLVLRIPMIQQLLMKAKGEYVSVDDEYAKYLSPSTVDRRTSSAKNLVDELSRAKSTIVRERADKLIW